MPVLCCFSWGFSIAAVTRGRQRRQPQAWSPRIAALYGDSARTLRRAPSQLWRLWLRLLHRLLHRPQNHRLRPTSHCPVRAGPAHRSRESTRPHSFASSRRPLCWPRQMHAQRTSSSRDGCSFETRTSKTFPVATSCCTETGGAPASSQLSPARRRLGGSHSHTQLRVQEMVAVAHA
jgi:hypothetical protein